MLAQRQWINQARTKKISHQLVFIYEDSGFYFQSWCQTVCMESKVLVTCLTLGMQMSRRVEERKRGLGCWMNDTSCRSCPPLPVRLLGSLTPVSAMQPPDMQHPIQPLKEGGSHLSARDTYTEFWGCVMWGFDAALTCELNLCLLGACSPHLRHQPPPGSHSPCTLAACPDTLVVVRCHWNDVRRRSDSQGLLLKVIAPAKEKPSTWINGHWTACEQKDKNGREKIN